MVGVSNAVSVRLEYSGLSQVVALARTFNRRSPAVAANTAGYRIARAAQKFTPVATLAKIDANMAATIVPVLSKVDGLPTKKKTVAVANPGPATKIVLARMHPGSRYNKLTGSYWAIDRMKFSPGEGATGFWRKVYYRAVTMVKARHSSTHFLMKGWTPGWRAILATGLVSKSANRGMATAPPSRRKYPNDSGYAIPAVEGIRARCEVGNRIGLGGSNAVLSEKHNRALHQYGGPALERAKAQEFDQTVTYVLKEMAKDTFAPAVSAGLIKFNP